jgi:uncharacterized repeat protein (TIGR01451 family)
VSCARSDALAAGASYPGIAVTVTVAQSAATPLTNVATVSGGGEIDTTNNSASDAVAVTSQADISIAKVASSARVNVGSPVTFTITAGNNGPSDATGVQVTDVLPAVLTYTSAAASQGTYQSGTGVWSVGTLTNGAVATLTITATVASSGPIVNTARKTAEDQPDPNPGNDTSAVTITGVPTASLPNPPNGGMAPIGTLAFRPDAALLAGAIGAGLPVGGVLLILLLPATEARRRRNVLMVSMALLTIGTSAAAEPRMDKPVPEIQSSPISPATFTVRADASDVELFGKPIAAVPQAPQIAVRRHPANGPITPTRIRIPGLAIDTVVEGVGVGHARSMEAPSNVWNAGWLRTGVRPGAVGQAVIDGHLDTVQGGAVFANLRGLRPGDRIYVSDDSGGELSFAVTAVQSLPLEGFPILQVFGPGSSRSLNLITCDGAYSEARRTYDHRTVVFSTLVP